MRPDCRKVMKSDELPVRNCNRQAISRVGWRCRVRVYRQGGLLRLGTGGTGDFRGHENRPLRLYLTGGRLGYVPVVT